MEIKKGMYVRTKNGYICEIINVNDFREPSLKYGVEASYLKDVMFIGDDDIKNAGYNIIDLIEVGDYVNGYRVVERIGNWLDLGSTTAEDKEIKSIVTHEQFKRMEYKV